MSYAANAYARTQRTAMTPREAEAAVLIKAAQLLQAVREDWANQSGGLAHALNFNQRVWTILVAGATDAQSPLPPELKQNVVNIAMFVFRRMLDTMAEPAAEKLSALISVNHNLAAGLQGR